MDDRPNFPAPGYQGFGGARGFNGRGPARPLRRGTIDLAGLPAHSDTHQERGNGWRRLTPFLSAIAAIAFLTLIVVGLPWVGHVFPQLGELP